MRMAISGQCIGNGIDHARCCTNCAQFAHPFNAKHIVGAWNALVGECLEHFGHDVCARCGVVHEAAGDQLTALCVVYQGL